MNDDHGGNGSVDSLLEQLLCLAGGVDADDLPGLAKMHSICESLAAPGDGDAPAAREFSRSAASLTRQLEALILGDAEDAVAALARIRDEARSLAGSVGSANAGAETPADVERLSASDVAARMDEVFDDAPPTAAHADGSAPNPPAPATGTSDQPMHDPPADPPGAPPPQTTDTATADPAYEPEPLYIKSSEVDLVVGFVEEAGEHLEAVEAAVLEVEREPGNTQNLDALFRPFHTIKGAAGFLNLRDINSLTHEAETLLDQARKGQREITPGLIDLVFDVVDILKSQFGAVQAYVSNPTGEAIPQPPIAGMIGHLRDVVAGRIQPASMNPVEGVPGRKVGETLVEQGVVPEEVVEFAVQEQERQPGKKTGEVLMEMGVATAKQVSHALRGQKPETAPAGTPGGAPKDAQERSLRIDTAKLDALVEMVGELVIAQTQVSANPRMAADPRLSKDVGHAAKIVRDVQGVAMAMRMVPIGPAFQKMARLVRDVSRKLDKQVHLSISGEDTELDKNVIQQIGDPLVHMVRNATDHGIESPEERRAQGKPEAGHVRLSAFHQGGNIVIQISDDGKGLDPKALIAKGIERGIVQPDETMTDQQAFQLIFAPGFSMAKVVSGISGRGVGMDVVRRNIEKLRGKVEIESTLGEGTTFSIRLPLTLAIIDGMVMRVGSERFILQTVVIEQALRPQRSQVSTVQRKGEVLNVRGRIIPLIQLGALLGLSEPLDPCEAMVIVAHSGDRLFGLVVDELIGQQQVVIKSLGKRFEKLQGVSGAAILGDGRVGLILEMSGVVAAYGATRSRATPPAPNGVGDARPDGAEPPASVDDGQTTKEQLATA